MSPSVSLVTIFSLLLLLFVTINVGRARVKYGVKPPEVSGNPDFERVLRVQQNTLEQIILFLPALWIFADFVSPIAASILGAIWIISRILYAWGYYQAAEKRGPGFAISTLATMVLLLGSLVGIGQQLFKG
jgi:glutathione S-transferase